MVGSHSATTCAYVGLDLLFCPRSLLCANLKLAHLTLFFFSASPTDGSGFARGNEIADKLDTLLEKVSEVSRTAQVSPGVPALPAFKDTIELEESDRLEEEEDVILELDKPARMPPHKHA